MWCWRRWAWTKQKARAGTARGSDRERLRRACAAGRSGRERTELRTLAISRDRRLQGAAQGSGRGVGAYTLIQRYREYKKRNVAEALPERL
jgi:hypothetical protein